MELLNINPRRNECAIVATFNALQWTGRPTSYHEIKAAAENEFGFNKKVGVSAENISGMLIKFDVPFKEVKTGTALLDVLKIVDRGSAILICYSFLNSKQGHIAMVTPSHRLINPDPMFRDWTTLKEALTAGVLHFAVWILK